MPDLPPSHAKPLDLMTSPAARRLGPAATSPSLLLLAAGLALDPDDRTTAACRRCVRARVCMCMFIYASVSAFVCFRECVVSRIRTAIENYQSNLRK